MTVFAAGKPQDNQTSTSTTHDQKKVKNEHISNVSFTTMIILFGDDTTW
jgi:hypothetical protein